MTEEILLLGADIVAILLTIAYMGHLLRVEISTVITFVRDAFSRLLLISQTKAIAFEMSIGKESLSGQTVWRRAR